MSQTHQAKDFVSFILIFSSILNPYAVVISVFKYDVESCKILGFAFVVKITEEMETTGLNVVGTIFAGVAGFFWQHASDAFFGWPGQHFIGSWL